jgi:hypothetical protein
VEEIAASTNRREAAMAMDRSNSPAFLALRPSVRRLLAFVELQVEHHCGEVTLYDDQFHAVIGSTRIYISGLRELHALGFIEYTKADDATRCTKAACPGQVQEQSRDAPRHEEARGR